MLLYKTGVNAYGDSSGYFATLHEIEVAKGKPPTLSPGVPATIEGLLAMSKALSPDRRNFGFLPETLLAIGMNHMAWWCPPKKRQVWFNCKVLGRRTASVPCPGLLFAVVGKARLVFALVGNGRPTPESALYQTPFYNVWQNGEVCEGSSKIPGEISIGAIPEWEESFFRSEFTHPNVHTPKGLIDWPRGIYAFWKKMLDGKIKSFPDHALVPLKMTAGDLIAKLENEEVKTRS